MSENEEENKDITENEENKESPENEEENKDIPENEEDNKDIPENEEENKDIPENKEVRDIPKNEEGNRDITENEEKNRDIPGNVQSTSSKPNRYHENEGIREEIEGNFEYFLAESVSTLNVRPNSRYVTRLQRRINNDTLLESLDFQICRNVLWRREFRKIKHLEKGTSVIRLVFYILIGLCTGAVTGLLSIIIFRAIEYQEHYIISGLSKDGYYKVLTAFLAVLAGTIFASIGAILVIVEPIIIASGLAKVLRYLNGVFHLPAFTMKSLVCKCCGLVLSGLAGIPSSMESVMVYIGACVAAIIWNFQFIFDCVTVLKFFDSDFEERNFILVGAASGIASGFGAPIGGVIFVLESTTNFWNQDNAWKTLIASAISTLMVEIIVKKFIHYPHKIDRFGFAELKRLFYNISDIPIYCIIGILGGLFGASFQYLKYRLKLFRMKHLQNWWKKFLEAIIASSIFNTMRWILIYFFVFCRPLPGNSQVLFKGRPLQIFCKPQEYNVMATLCWKQLVEVLGLLYTAPPGEFPLSILCIHGIFMYFAIIFSHGLFATIGIIYPIIFIGSIFGRLFGEFMALNFSEQLPGKYALIGGAASLGGIIHNPLSYCLIYLEANDIITPYILPLVIAFTTADLVSKAFKQVLIDATDGKPFLPRDPPAALLQLKAADIMAYPVICFKIKESAQYISETLQLCDHNAFPIVTDVVDDNRSTGQLVGIILRSQLLTILVKGYFEERGHLWKERVTIGSFRRFQHKYPTANVIQINLRHRRYTVDFRIFMNPSPIRVNKLQIVPTIFRLYRGLTHRHIVVVDDYNRVVGIITRKDFLQKRQKWSIKNIFKG